MLHFEPIAKSNTSYKLGVLTERSLVSEWHICGKFGREGQGKGELRFAKGVATTKEGMMAIADDTNRRVTVYGRDGRYQFTLTAESRRFGNLMHVPSDVAVTKTGESCFHTFRCFARCEKNVTCEYLALASLALSLVCQNDFCSLSVDGQYCNKPSECELYSAIAPFTLTIVSFKNHSAHIHHTYCQFNAISHHFM